MITQLSVLINKVTCGPKGYSLCARFYEGSLKGSNIHKFFVGFSDSIFFWDKDHCKSAWQLRSKK